MKKLIFILFFIPFIANSQKIFGGKNIIKTNIFGDAISNYNLTYEHSLAKKMSLSVGFRYMPKMQMPQYVKDKVVEAVGDQNLRINEFEMGNFAITPELRLYLSAGKMKGFYIAPYVRYASFDLKVPMNYDYTSGSGDKAYALFNGTFTSLSGGIMFGSQFQIAKKIVLDWWIIGAHYGTSSGTITATDFNPAITNQAQADAFNNKVNELSNKDYAGIFKFKGQLSSDWKTATFDITGAWAGVRAGLCLGVRF